MTSIDVGSEGVCTIDNQNSCAVAASLGKVIQSRKLQRVLIATTKQLLVPFLKPDFVIIAHTAEVVINPASLKERAIKIVFHTPGMGSFMHKKPAAWDGEVDSVKDVLNVERKYEAMRRVKYVGMPGERPLHEIVVRVGRGVQERNKKRSRTGPKSDDPNLRERKSKTPIK